jgi:hypothetical protein
MSDRRSSVAALMNEHSGIVGMPIEFLAFKKCVKPIQGFGDTYSVCQTRGYVVP